LLEAVVAVTAAMQKVQAVEALAGILLAHCL
jgi:hypothetical protein